MTVYILSEGTHGEGSQIVGVYATLEQARARVRTTGSLDQSFLAWMPGEMNVSEWWQSDSDRWEYNAIERWEVSE